MCCLKKMSNLIGRKMKTYSKSRIELQKPQILRKCWKNQASFVNRAAL